MTITKPQPRQIFLCLLMLVVGFFFFRQYLGMIQIPTEHKLQEKRQQLESLRNDLKVAEIDAQKRWEAMSQLSHDAEPYWMIDSSSRVMVDQVINREFYQILRKAQLTYQPKISVSRNKVPGLNHLQQVQIRLDHRAISMKELSRLFEETEKYGRKLVWNYCRIEPDHPSNPTNVRFSAKINTLVLNPDAADFLTNGLLKPGQGGSR